MKRPKSMRPFGQGFQAGIRQLGEDDTALNHLCLFGQLLFYPVLYLGYYIFFNLNGDDNGQV